MVTLGLIGVGMACGRHMPQQLSLVVVVYTTAEYWLTPSSLLANPALALAYTLIDGPPGIRPGDVLSYMLTQLVSTLLATSLLNQLMSADIVPAQVSGTTIAPAQAVPRRHQAS